MTTTNNKTTIDKLSEKILGKCAGRNHENRHASFGDMIYGMRTECEFAVEILNVK